MIFLKNSLLTNLLRVILSTFIALNLFLPYIFFPASFGEFSHNAPQQAVTLSDISGPLSTEREGQPALLFPTRITNMHRHTLMRNPVTSCDYNCLRCGLWSHSQWARPNMPSFGIGTSSRTFCLVESKHGRTQWRLFLTPHLGGGHQPRYTGMFRSNNMHNTNKLH
ncbi:unnamed protein product [Trypanosoma congolense IL3000]|uniref:WGS project CAEQ00000000 data, annotated contig 11 n=1 Tax=Trypanosoma congolense (strain IL3000) TaxID=1068625 RepID=F9W481_TRYCI|nr:unnamed protein product [Trypanosoma congolense IL3000]